jgi:uncharacterized Rossmann fold enzyme
MKINFACVNVGPRYPMSYVEILRDSVLRNASTMDHQVAFWAITDRPDELPEGVYPIPTDPTLPGWWAKVQLFSPQMPWEDGERVVYFDLDVAITGRLEDLVERKGIIRDWHWPMFNSSVMCWDAGEHRQIWNGFTRDLIDKPAPAEIAKLLPSGEVNAGDQHWITQCAPDWPTFPTDWTASYRYCQGWPPSGCKVVVFHGKAAKPHEITDGWVPNVWKVGGFTSLPKMTGVNTTEDARIANVRSNSKRDLQWFTGFKDVDATAVVCAGGPSMKDHLSDIGWHARNKAKIITVNNAWRTLVDRGIKPRIHIMLDARPENAEFVKDAPDGMRFFLASQCHDDVFEALADRDVVVWHNGWGTNEPLWNELLPYHDSKPIIIVPGGCTVGLRALWLCAFSGFRKIHVYGMDSSYADDGSHHAYPQALNDGEQVFDVAMGGKTYRCAPWMSRQAVEFEQTWHDLKNFRTPDGRHEPVRLMVHGKGLVPDMARALRAQEREREKAA